MRISNEDYARLYDWAVKHFGTIRWHNHNETRANWNKRPKKEGKMKR